MRRKIAAIFAADIAGYSRLIAEDEEETIRRLKAYRKVTDEFIVEAGGRIFNTAGDAVLAEFPSAVDAVRCAIDIQESLRTRNSAFPPSRHMSFRIGITIGDVHESDGDLLGEGVNIAARLEGLAEVGGICVSRGVYEQVANRVSVPFTDMGAQPIKNMDPVHAYMVGKQSGGEVPASRDSLWGILLKISKPTGTHSESGVTEGWKRRLKNAWDRRTLLDSFILLVALNCVLSIPAHARTYYFGENLLGLAGAALVSSSIVLIAVSLLDRRFGLSWAQRIMIALAYGAATLLGPASVPVLQQLGLDQYTAGYAGRVDLAFMFGCMGAGAVMWSKFRSHTVFVALLCMAILLAVRYAVFEFAPATMLAVLPLPVVLIGTLMAMAGRRASAGLDAAVIAGAWLAPIALWLTILAIAGVMPGVVLGPFKYVDPLAFMGLSLPSALAWPALRLARPGTTWAALSGSLVIDRYLVSGMGALASVLVVSLAANILYRSTSIYRCHTLAKIDACAALIDSPSEPATDRLAALERRPELYSQESKWDQAIADRSRLIELDPRNPERYTARAEFWSQIDSFDQAVTDLDTALSLQPNNVKTRLARFEMWKRKGDDRQAMAELDHVIRLEPTADNFVRRAKYNKDNKRLAAAISDYSMAIRMDPKNIDRLKGRANLFEDSGDAKAAEADYMSIIDVYDAEIEKAPSADIFRKRAEIWESLKNYPRAVTDYTSAIQLEPTDGAYYFLGELNDQPPLRRVAKNDRKSCSAYEGSRRVRVEGADAR